MNKPDVEQAKEASKKSRRNLWRAFFLTACLVIICLLGVLAYLFYSLQNQISKTGLNDARAITERISQVVALPNEEPTVASVLDKAKLSNPVLASKAENGDQLLIYPLAKRIVLYRPAIQKVIEILVIESAAAVP